MHKLKKYIIEQQKEKVEYIIADGIPLVIKDKLISDIDIKELINRIENTLPNISKHLVNSVVVANLDAFAKKKMNALYHNNIIYISNDQDDITDMLDDIVHEYSHAMEEEYGSEIYSDQSIKDEFLFKREELERIIRHQKFDISKYNFNNLEYDREFDKLLLNVIGYERLNNLTNHGLFINPYAVTSLREYFATGFEEYVMGDHRELKTISPKLYKKIYNIMQII